MTEFHSLERAAADECLRTVFEDELADLTMDEGSLLITDLLRMNRNEGIGDLYEAARELRDRIHPATLKSYADALVASHESSLEA